jgi:FAD:protein FMN transferase
MSQRLHFVHQAMATEFEIVFTDSGIDPTEAQGIAGLVFKEVDRMEEELSRFKPGSDVWRINGLRAGESICVDFATIDCLQLAQAVHEATAGAFDITAGPLMRCWRNPDGSPRTPDDDEIAETMKRVGIHLLEVDARETRVSALADYLTVDLGAVGKGYALDQAVRILEEQEVSGALLNAGSSTILAWGSTPHPNGWPIDLALPTSTLLGLKDSALSCSGFDVQGAHIMDPRTGRPVPATGKLTYLQAPTAALSDALSTAFVVMTAEEQAQVLAQYPQVSLYQ